MSRTQNGNLNIANILSLVRVCMIPLFIWIYMSDIQYSNLIALAVFVVASLTDWLDGLLARKLNLITKLGQFLDPLADKLLVISALICMVEKHVILGWMVTIIIARELIISIFRAVAASDGIVLAASKWGKLKTVIQMIAIILLLLANTTFDIAEISSKNIFVWLAVILTVVSGVDYIYKNRQVLK